MLALPIHLPTTTHPPTHPSLSLLEVVARLVPKNNRERKQQREREREDNNLFYFPSSLLFNPAFFSFSSPTLLFKLPLNSWAVLVPHSPFSAEITFLPSQTLACWGSKFHLPSPLCPLEDKHALITGSAYGTVCNKRWRRDFHFLIWKLDALTAARRQRGQQRSLVSNMALVMPCPFQPQAGQAINRADLGQGFFLYPPLSLTHTHAHIYAWRDTHWESLSPLFALSHTQTCTQALLSSLTALLWSSSLSNSLLNHPGLFLSIVFGYCLCWFEGGVSYVSVCLWLEVSKERVHH